MKAGGSLGTGWRGPAALLAGVAGLGLLLASESLAARFIYDVTLRYPGIDKVAHFVQYAVIVSILWRLVGVVVEDRWRRAALAAAIALLLGASDEFFQRLVADRSFEVADLGANMTGVLLGIGLGPTFAGRRQARTAALALAVIGAAGLAGASYWHLRHFNRGMLLTREGDLPKALAEYRLALRDGLATPSFYNELAWIEVESGVGDVHAAVTYAARALAANPRNPDVLDTYGWALHRAGRSREALPLLERAFAAKPRMFCIHYHLGEVYSALGDGARGAHHLAEQVRLFPGGSEARRAAASLRAHTMARAGRAEAPPAP